MTASELVDILKSSRPCQLKSRLLRKRPFLPHMGPCKLGQTFLYDQAWLGCASSRLDHLLQRPWVWHSCWMLTRCGVGTTVHGTLRSCAFHLSCSVVHIRNGPIQLLTALSETKFWETRSLPLQGGQPPCRILMNTRSHPWKYEQKCDMRTKQTASTHANPCMCLSSSLHHSFEGDKEPNFCARS